MASLPQQSPAPQHQRSPEESSSNGQEGPSSSQEHRRSSISQSLNSEDSQTVLLNPPSSSENSLKSDQTQEPTSQRPKLKRSRTSKEPKICWICFADETEDTPSTSRWRSPCPCALKAHEACLLDWIADLQTPGKQPKPIECPQCKSKLVVSRPRSVVTDLVVAGQRAAFDMSLPCLVATLAGTVIVGFWLHGFGTVYIVFGPQDANRLLGLDLPASCMNNNWAIGMPLIPVGLVASRTKSSSVEILIAGLPCCYFFLFGDDIRTWPPSPATTLAALGLVRLAYNQFYYRFLTPLEEKWLKELKPRVSENRDVDAENQEVIDRMQLGFELQIEVEEDAEEEIVHDQQRGRERQAQPPADAAAQIEEGLGQIGDGEQHPPAAAAPAPPQDRREHLWDLDIIAFAQKAMGALLFPSIAAAMGQGLEMVLPRTWTTPPIRGLDRYPAGFLQSRFGRTVVGGCLFVVLKDALQLYATYQLASSHKHRRVANYDEIPKRIGNRLKD